MIVKNEASVIRRCLKSVRPILDHWVIVDTGSTDNTREEILDTLHGVPGELHSRPFTNFSESRNHALELARPHGDYILQIDADHELVINDDFKKHELTADYIYTREDGYLDYEMRLLLASRLPWHYVGVTHENLEVGCEFTRAQAKGVRRLDHADGSSRINKFIRDVVLLTRELAINDKNPRSWFYLGQSLYPLGQFREARNAYRSRIGLGGWEEERWYAAYMYAACGENLNLDEATVISDYLAAHAMRPHRLESLYSLVTYLRKRERYELGYIFGLRGAQTVYPKDDRLFIHRDVYSVKFWDEFALCCHYTCHKDLSIIYGARALKASPNDERLQRNFALYRY